MSENLKYEFALFFFLVFMLTQKMFDKMLPKEKKESEETYKINGKVEKGWEQVKHAFSELYRHGNDEHSQLVVYHKDKKVVDLWG